MPLLRNWRLSLSSIVALLVACTDPRKGIAGVLYNHCKYVNKWDSGNPTLRAIAQAHVAAIPETDGGTDFPAEDLDRDA